MSAPLDVMALSLARSRARRRDPDGRRMGLFRWAESEGAVWLFPAALVEIEALIPVASASRWQVGETPDPVRFAYWLAAAARQDVWRALNGVPGLMPVIRVEPDPAGRTVAVTVAALVPPKRTSAAIADVLADIYQPRRINAWTVWAHRKAAGGAGAVAAG